MEIYIITRGSYDDYAICTVTQDKEEAERLKVFFTEDQWDPAEIETWETSNNTIWLAGLKCFTVVLDRDMRHFATRRLEPSEYYPGLLGVYDFGASYHIRVLAKDREAAIEAARKELEKYLAEKE